MTKIGYIGGGFKPFHAGHYALIQAAAKECDLVRLFVSTGDRNRMGEVPIKGSAMQEIWSKYLLNIMPQNIDVTFTPSPVRKIYETIGEEDKSADTDVLHIIYSDDADLGKNYPEKNLKRYFPRLSEIGKVAVKPYPRTATVNISGTTMRKFIELGLRNDFIDGLPEPVRNHGLKIWKLLGGGDAV
jgi:cytidyltransferase-like protein